MVKKYLAVVVVVLVVLAAQVAPVRADGEPWRLLELLDCNMWSNMCREDSAWVAVDSNADNDIGFSSVSCTRARMYIEQYDPVTVTIEMGAYGDAWNRIISTDEQHACFDLINVIDLEYINLTSISDAEVYGIVIDCYDPLPAPTPVAPSLPEYGAAPDVEPATLAAMTMAGGDILQSSGATLLPMILGLSLGMALVVVLLRLVGWL